MTTASDVPERASRQEALAPHEKLRAAKCVVIGVGAVGRQVALQLAAMGAGAIDLWDHDAVEEVNLVPQAWRPDQLGLNKAGACRDDCEALNPEAQVRASPRRFARSDAFSLRDAHVFSCVDSIAVRKAIFEAARLGDAPWLGDARVAGETCRILAEDRLSESSKYAASLFAPGEAFVGACTAKMTAYMAAVAAGLLVAQFARRLRGLPPIRDQLLGVTAGELAAEE